MGTGGRRLRGGPPAHSFLRLSGGAQGATERRTHRGVRSGGEGTLRPGARARWRARPRDAGSWRTALRLRAIARAHAIAARTGWPRLELVEAVALGLPGGAEGFSCGFVPASGRAAVIITPYIALMLMRQLQASLSGWCHTKETMLSGDEGSSIGSACAQRGSLKRQMGGSTVIRCSGKSTRPGPATRPMTSSALVPKFLTPSGRKHRWATSVRIQNVLRISAMTCARCLFEAMNDWNACDGVGEHVLLGLMIYSSIHSVGKSFMCAPC